MPSYTTVSSHTIHVSYSGFVKGSISGSLRQFVMSKTQHINYKLKLDNRSVFHKSLEKMSVLLWILGHMAELTNHFSFFSRDETTSQWNACFLLPVSLCNHTSMHKRFIYLLFIFCMYFCSWTKLCCLSAISDPLLIPTCSRYVVLWKQKIHVSFIFNAVNFKHQIYFMRQYKTWKVCLFLYFDVCFESPVKVVIY